MPAPQSGSPMTYMANGKQYIVVAVSGGAYSGEYIAFRFAGRVRPKFKMSDRWLLRWGAAVLRPYVICFAVVMVGRRKRGFRLRDRFGMGSSPRNRLSAAREFM